MKSIYQSTPPLTAETPLKIPLKMMATVILSVVTAVFWVCTMYFSIKGDVEAHTKDIQSLKQSEREQREILIRVDENLKEVKRRLP